MIIGNFKIESIDDMELVIKTAKATLTFDKMTMTQTNAKNPKFANKITIVK